MTDRRRVAGSDVLVEAWEVSEQDIGRAGDSVAVHTSGQQQGFRSVKVSTRRTW